MKSVALLVALATLIASPALTQDRRRGRPYNKNVITEARNLNGLFDRVRAYSRVKSSWIAVKTDINTLAALYDLRPVR